MQESISVHLEKSFMLPPFLEQVVLAIVQGSVPGGPYLLECNEKRLPCVVARALFHLKAGRVPIQLLNIKSEYVTIPSRVEDFGQLLLDDATLGPVLRAK